MSNKVYIIAEIGINFNGSFDNCLRLIDIAAQAGCNAAKFQLFRAESLYPRSAGSLDWKDEQGSYSYDIFSAVQKNELPAAWIDPLMQHCHKQGVDFLTSVFSEADLRAVAGKGMQSLKISSSSVSNLPFIRQCAATGLPLIISTGGARLGETEDVVEAVSPFDTKLSLLHCSLQYPTPPENCHLGAIETLKKAFPGVIIGYSDHTYDPCEAPRQAVYLGAEIIEKHITLDKKMTGPDHFFALEPQELHDMVAAIRSAEKDLRRGINTIDPVYYGSSRKTPGDHELYLRQFVQNQLFAKHGIAGGETIRPEDLITLRRGKKGEGLLPRHLELFERFTITARRDILAEEPITWDMIL